MRASSSDKDSVRVKITCILSEVIACDEDSREISAKNIKIYHSFGPRVEFKGVLNQVKVIVVRD